MSEIKGQLLGIILTLMVFAGVSITVANLYSKTAGKVSDYGEHIEEGAADEAGYEIPQPNGAFPGLNY